MSQKSILCFQLKNKLVILFQTILLLLSRGQNKYNSESINNFAV